MFWLVAKTLQGQLLSPVMMVFLGGCQRLLWSFQGVARVLVVVARMLLCGLLKCPGWLPGYCYASAKHFCVVARVLLYSF